MQTNQIAEQVPQVPPHSHVEETLAALRAAPQPRSERNSAEDSRGLAPQRPARKPGLYGAGF
jgi:hypothetical protein